MGVLVGAIVLPVAIAWAGSASIYWLDLSSNSWAVQYLSYLVAIGVGTFSALSYPFVSNSRQRWVVTVYVMAALITIWWVALFTACSFGDCL